MGLSWSDLDPRTWPGQVKSRYEKDFGGPDVDADRKQLLSEQAAKAGRAADIAEAEAGVLGGESVAARNALQQRAEGKNLLSTEQLRQGTQQLINAQRSMAAGAPVNDAAARARQAMKQTASLGYGMSGQAATAGIAERAAAEKAYTDMLLAQRQQAIAMAQGGRSTAVQGLGGGAAGPPEKGFIEKYGPAIAAAAAMFSDRDLKTDISEISAKDARKTLSKLHGYRYTYKDPAHGKGPQVSVMAQDLEAAGLGHAVIDTPKGKMVHGAKLAASGMALTASLAKRVDELEKRKRKAA
jgi:hypothetical protein